MIKSKLPKLKFAVFGLLVLLLALSPATPVFAQDVGLGHGFYGTVKIGGEDAEIGTVISAQVAEMEYDSYQVVTLGQYALIVQGEIEDGATINFYINGYEADQTFPFNDGWTTQLDLAVAEPEPEPDIAPTVVTNAASALTTTSATLNGNLTGLGTASSVGVSFEWGTTDIYGNTATVTASPLNAPSVFSASLSGLSPSTTYHFRALAVGDGTGYGVDRTFTTTTPGGGGGGGAGPAPPTPPPGTTDIRGMVDTGCSFTKSATVTSEDELCTLTIPEGTVGLTEELACIARISMVIMDEPPDPPEDAHVIGLAYDFGPDGATFDPPITLIFSYDPNDIPEGVAEEDLVIAMWDEEAGEWVELDGVVDTVNNTITASVSHFTTFAIIGKVPAAPPEEEVPTVVPPVGEEEEEEEEEPEVVMPVKPEPAAFSVSYLSFSPLEVEPGEAVTITVLVANIGGESGSYAVVLKIDGVKEAEKTVTIAAGDSQDVSFSVTREEAGDYTVDVDGLSGSFTVLLPVKPPGVNWPLIGGIIAAVVVVVGLLYYFLVFRRRAY